MDKISKEFIYKKMHRLKKSDMAELLNENPQKLCKDDLLQRLKERLEEDDFLWQRLYRNYKNTFSLISVEVEEILGCTKAERLRWTRESKLPVDYYAEWRNYGKTIDVPIYNLLGIVSAREKVESWREEYEREKKNRKSKVGKKISESKVKNKELREEERKKYLEMIASWYRDDEQKAVALELAFWTVWASRLAKENTIKSFQARKEHTRKSYDKKIQDFYHMKNEAIRRLYKLDFSSLSFYRRELLDSAKISDVSLCDYHQDMLEMDTEFYHIPFWDWFIDEYKSIKSCTNCSYKLVEEYYSLYYLEIGQGGISFGFHIPHPIGKDFLPAPEDLKLVDHQEDEGLFSFGRPLLGSEKVIYRDNFVEKRFAESLAKYDYYFKNKEVPQT